MQSQKSFTVCWILCLLLGHLGIHRFYVGKIGTGILMVLTLGGLWVWTVIDFIRIVTGNFTDHAGNVVRQSATVQQHPNVNSDGEPAEMNTPSTNQGTGGSPSNSKSTKPAVIGCLVLFVAVITLMVTCVVSLGGSSDSPSYAGGRYSCSTFKSTQSEIAQGFLTLYEMRDAMKKVQIRGSTAEPEIRVASAALLRHVTAAGIDPTQQDLDNILSASLSMTEACKQYGY